MNFIIDENLPPSWCEYLIENGYYAQHWKDIGTIGDPDEIIFNAALSKRCIILTQDLDFARILASRGTKLPSLIQLRVDCPIPSKVGKLVLEMLRTYEKQLIEGALVSLEYNQRRIRLLPL